MREIKFRAWDKEEKKIVEVHGINFRYHELDVTTLGEEYVKSYVCRDFELMQYTGLKDKNGKKIYEGDIFIHKNDHKFVVEWNEDRFIGLDNKRNGDGYCCYISSCDELGNSAIEVIGNIYENPELMREGKDEKNEKR